MISDEYAAGFFDGEGSVYAAVRRNRTIPVPTVLVCISNTNLAILEEHKLRWGGSIHARKKGEGWQLQHQWVLAPRNARKFLISILPHLHIKREVASAAKDLCDLMAKPHKERLDYSYFVIRDGKRWVAPIVRPEFRAKVEERYRRIRELNSKSGPGNVTRSYDLNANVYAPNLDGRVQVA